MYFESSHDPRSFPKMRLKSPFSSSSSSSSSCSAVIRKSRLTPYLLVLLPFILFLSLLYVEDLRCILSQQLATAPELTRPVSRTGELTESASCPCPWSPFSSPSPGVHCICMRAFRVRSEGERWPGGGGGGVAVCGGDDGGGRVRRVQREVGKGRGDSAAVPGVGVPVHTAAADVPGARPPWSGLPVLAVAAPRLLPAKVPPWLPKFLSTIFQ